MLPSSKSREDHSLNQSLFNVNLLLHERQKQLNHGVSTCPKSSINCAYPINLILSLWNLVESKPYATIVKYIGTLKLWSDYFKHFNKFECKNCVLFLFFGRAVSQLKENKRKRLKKEPENLRTGMWRFNSPHRHKRKSKRKFFF